MSAVTGEKRKKRMPARTSTQGGLYEFLRSQEGKSNATPELAQQYVWSPGTQRLYRFLEEQEHPARKKEEKKVPKEEEYSIETYEAVKKKNQEEHERILKSLKESLKLEGTRYGYRYSSSNEDFD